MVPESNMPNYVWLYDQSASVEVAADKMRVLKKLGVPYTDQEIANAAVDYRTQASMIVDNLVRQGVVIAKSGQDQAQAKEEVRDLEITALIAYLMRLGKNLEPAARVVDTGGR